MTYTRRLPLAPAARATLVFLLLPALAFAATKAATKAAPAPAAAKKTAAPSASPMAGLGAIGLPQYQEPPAYSVDLVIDAHKDHMVMKRYVDNGRLRTEISAQGQDMVMIETGDEKGTTYMLMPEDKRAIKQSRQAMSKVVEKAQKQAAEKHEGKAPEAKVEDLGVETLNGRTVKKLRMSMDEGSALGWFDQETGAPVRMESTVNGEKSAIEWQNMKVGPQPAKLYDIPKGYDVMDMDEMMAKAQSMGGAGMLGGLAGAAGMPGGGMGAMAGGMAGNMAQSFGSNMGGQLGATLGMSLGGPLGAMAGQYLGGKIGGMIGKKAVDVVTPGP